MSSDGGRARLLLNEGSPGRHWIQVALRGHGGNRRGIGAVIAVVPHGAGTRTRSVRTESSYLSASEPKVHFGLGTISSLDRIEVTWPGGGREEFRPPSVDRMVTLVEGTGRAVPSPR